MESSKILRANMVARLLKFFTDIWRQRRVIWLLARREFMSRYAGTTFGVIWVVAQPVATILIFWFVFAVGLRMSGPTDSPFLPYFVCGLVPWLMFSEVLTMTTNGIRGNLQLIKKTPFPSEVLPFVYIGAASAGHVVLLGVLLLLMHLYGMSPGIAMVALPAYFIALCFLLIGLCWITSALNVFHRDVGQMVGIVINLWFWLTPIVWARDLLPDRFAVALALNPMAFIVDGYRHALLGGALQLAMPNGLTLFAGISLILFLLGAAIFRRLKTEFADSF